MTPSLPSGRVTFVFTDVVGSTRTFIEHGEAYVEALTLLHARTATHAESRNGVVVETEGDGAFLAFPDAASGVEALIALQEELEAATGPRLRLRIRAGAHTGDAVPVGGNYLALPVYVAARVSASANAGQVLVTDAVVEELKASGWARIRTAVEVGSYSLKDIADPVRLWRLAGEPAPPRATPARRTNVQQSRTSFVGRERELGHLRDLAADPGLVTAVGPGGVGKTRLVSEFALHEAETFLGGAWLVELAALEAPDQLVPATAASLGVTKAETTHVEIELKRRGRSLLVLDNCEHLIDSVAEFVQQLLDACPDLTILCTSREALSLAEERIWTVRPLPPGEPSIRLFVDRSPSSHGRELDPDLVREICAALDGLPLAIELAASQSRSAPLQELLETVRSGTDPFVRRGGPERQRSLDAILQWSLDRLTPRLRASLLVLSVFPGRFSPAMARSVLEAVPTCDASATKELARRSVVDLDGDDYRLLTTIRDAARRLLALDQDLNREALDALVEWTKAYGAERWRSPGYHEDVSPDTLLAIEAGLMHALDAGIPGLGKAWRLVDLLSGSRGASAAVLAMAERALEMHPSNPDEVLVLAAACWISMDLGAGRGPSAGQVAEMIEVGRASGDPRVLERALYAAAGHEEARGDHEAAQAHRTEILELAKSTPELSFNLPAALTNLANSYFYQGNLGSAIEYTLRSAAASRKPEFRISHAIAHGNLSEFALIDGRPEDACDHALTALKTAPPDWRLRGIVMARLARAHSLLDDHAAALAAGRDALPDLRRMAQHNQQAADELAGLLDEVPELAVE